MKFLALLTVASLSLALALGSVAEAQAVDITADEAKAMLDENDNLTLIDVSSLYEFGHIPGALNLSVFSGELYAAMSKLDKEDPYLVYCHTGVASNLATEKLTEAGFTNVYRLYGNISGWQSAGYETAMPSYSDVGAEEALSLIEGSGIIVIDVSPIYTSGHLPGAISLPLGDGSLDMAVSHFDPNADYLVYCHTDESSIAGSQTLVDAGFTQVKRLQGNYSGWAGAGYFTESSSGSYSDLEPGEANVFMGMTPGIVIIDVSPHYAEGHIPGALNYTYNDKALHAAIPKISKAAQILVYCHIDATSMGASQTLKDAGFRFVNRLSGNYSAWKSAGLKVETAMYMDVSAAEAQALTEEKRPPVIIDVSPVYRAGHLPGSVNYSLGDGTINMVSPLLDKNGDYLVYCHTDGASQSGAQVLVDAGFTRVKRLEGNYSGWTGAGYEVAASPPEYKDISAMAAHDLIDNTANIMIVDVSPIFDQGHIQDAVNYPFGSGEFDAKIPDLDKNGTYLIYCHSDPPSQGAATALDEAGFDSVFRLHGNVAGWLDAGFDLVIITSVEETSPTAFRLDGAYPNPFNPSTTIQFEIPENGSAKIAIYDALGRKVADILDGYVSAGSHDIQWNGTDDRGIALGSGMYIVKLSASGLTAQRKISLLR